MGQCFTCRKSKDKFKVKGTKLCNRFQLSVSHEANCSYCLGGPDSCSDSMATSFSNMNLTNPIKKFVSKGRKRYKKDGFNLDLTYITDRIIAMGYPASNIESVYRNDIDDVVKFLDKKHLNHYFVYNLCSERNYDISRFHNRVKTFPFDDHNPPKIETIQPFCNDVSEWLSRHQDNVAVVHCKAGKGRTGTMICCYLLHSGLSKTADEALNYYGQKRTQDQKGVTIPSQLRYVRYYESLLRNNFHYNTISINIKEFILDPVPSFTGGQGCLSYSISHQTLEQEGETTTPKCKKLRKNDVFEVKRGCSPFSIKLDYCLPLTGDIKVEFYNKSIMRKEKLFQFWFNTYFVTEHAGVNGYIGEHDMMCYNLVFDKNELDIVNKKDKQNKVFSADFKLTLVIQKIPDDVRIRETQAQDTPSESSAESYDESDEDDWDSVVDGGEEHHQLDPRGVGYRILSECEIASHLAPSGGEQQQTELVSA